MFNSYFLLRKYYKNRKDYDMPFIPSNNQRVKTMLELAQIKPGEKSVDLGAGDGKVMIAFAKTGAHAFGIEIDEILSEIIRHKINKNRLNGKAFIFNGDLWNHNLSEYDIITVYGLSWVMARLEEKIGKEGKSGCRIIANYFPFPNLKPEKVKKDIYLYRLYSQGVMS